MDFSNFIWIHSILSSNISYSFRCYPIFYSNPNLSKNWSVVSFLPNVIKAFSIDRTTFSLGKKMHRGCR